MHNLSHLQTLNNELLEKMGKAITFIISSKRIQNVGKNLTKEVKDSYLESYDTDEKIEDNRKRWKDKPC